VVRSSRRPVLNIVAVSILAITVTTGCSVATPVIAATGARLVVVATGPDGGRDERLSLFASVADGDGVDDLDYLYVVHDGDELCWTMTRDDWQRDDAGAAVWLGANSLDAPGPTMPRGQYRVVLVDLAGERAERVFSLSAPETSAYDLPAVRLSGDRVIVDTAYPVNTAFFFDSGGNVVLTVPVAEGETSLDSLWADGQWRSGSDYIAVYGLEPKAEIGFFSWKIRLPD